jgi:hypothetical protein
MQPLPPRRPTQAWPPVRYSAQVAMSICDRPADGESLRCSISRIDDMMNDAYFTPQNLTHSHQVSFMQN